MTQETLGPAEPAATNTPPSMPWSLMVKTLAAELAVLEPAAPGPAARHRPPIAPGLDRSGMLGCDLAQQRHGQPQPHRGKGAR